MKKTEKENRILFQNTIMLAVIFFEIIIPLTLEKFGLIQITTSGEELLCNCVAITILSVIVIVFFRDMVFD